MFCVGVCVVLVVWCLCRCSSLCLCRCLSYCLCLCRFVLCRCLCSVAVGVVCLFELLFCYGVWCSCSRVGVVFSSLFVLCSCFCVGVCVCSCLRVLCSSCLCSGLFE